MKTLRFKIDTINKVKEFCNLASQHLEELTVSSGRYVVDAKSIMGLFSLELMKEIELTIPNDEQYSWFVRGLIGIAGEVEECD
jgi:hypothetical protein